MNGMRILGYLEIAVPIPFKGCLCTNATSDRWQSFQLRRYMGRSRLIGCLQAVLRELPVASIAANVPTNISPAPCVLTGSMEIADSVIGFEPR